MTCETVRIGGVVAIVCGRGRRDRKRCHCGAPATKLCDHRGAGRKKTCDAPLCDAHAVRIGANIDFCPGHAKDRQP